MKMFLLLPGGIIALSLLAGCRPEPEQSREQALLQTNLRPHSVIAVGRVEPAGRLTALSTEASGIVATLEAQAGDSLEKGDVILTLNDAVEAAELALSQARLATQRQEIIQAQASLKAAQATLLNSRLTFERLAKVHQQGAETGQNLDDAHTDYQVAQLEVKRLEGALTSAQAKYAELQQDVRLKEAQMAKKNLRAPAKGVLLTMDAQPGVLLSPGSTVGEFAPAGPLLTVCEVDELFAGSVHPGQSALIRQQGNNQVLARGTVTYAAPSLKKKSLFSDEASGLEDRRVREVKIKLTQGDTLLLNSRVECESAVR
jgi:multidrug resistance efflux pump